MICKCGYTLNEKHIYCPNCGEKVITQQQQRLNNFNVNQITHESSQQSNTQVESKLLMTINGLCLYKGKQPIGNLKIYSDKVEFVHNGRNFATSALIGGMIGGMIAASNSKETDIVDCFMISDISVANKSKHPSLSSYIEIVLKDGKKFKYLDRTGKHSKNEMFSAVDTINSLL